MTEETKPGGIPSDDDNAKQAKEATPGLHTMTLAERGPVLSLGVPDAAGALHRDIAVRPWKGAVMRQLGKLREENQELRMAEHVPLVLSTLCTRLGPHDFADMPLKEKKLVVNQMYMGDTFHAYCWARLQSLGPNLHIDLTCPVCRHEFEFVGDLANLTVTVADSYEAALWMYELQEPIELRGQKVERLIMGPSQWHHVEHAQIEGSLDLEGGKLAMVAGVIRGIEGRGEFPLTEGEVDELSGLDIEGIIGELDHHYVGPDMRIDTRCARKGCRGRILRPINWSYQDFFGGSSRSRTKRNSTTSSSQPPTSQKVA